mgnify:CR=1 FL=1
MPLKQAKHTYGDPRRFETNAPGYCSFFKLFIIIWSFTIFSIFLFFSFVCQPMALPFVLSV